MRAQKAANARKDRSETLPRINERQEWMDVLRGICILLVFSLHASLIAEHFDRAAWQPLVEFNEVFAPYRMPALMFLSGMLLHKSLEKNLLAYVDGKSRRIAYPYFVWTCIYGLIVTSSFEWHNPWLWMGASYLWYLFFLLVCYATAPWFRHINSLYVALACLLLSYLMPDDTKYQERLLCLMGYFFLGHFVVSQRKILNAMLDKRMLIPALPLVIALSWMAQRGDGLSYRAELLAPTLAGIVVLIQAARWISSREISRPLKFIGIHSLVFYVAHYPLMYVVSALALEMAAPSAGPATAGISFAIAIGACTALAWSYTRVAMMRWLFVMPVVKRRSGHGDRQAAWHPPTSRNPVPKHLSSQGATDLNRPNNPGSWNGHRRYALTHPEGWRSPKPAYADDTH
jgi:uncharacterized membrane protein YcfT